MCASFIAILKATMRRFMLTLTSKVELNVEVNQDQLSPNAGQKYCRMLREEHSAILSTFIKIPCNKENFPTSEFS